MAHSAYGALASDIHTSAEQSLLMRGGGGTRDPWEGLDPAAIDALFDELEALLPRADRGGGDRSRQGRNRPHRRPPLPPPDPRPDRPLGAPAPVTAEAVRDAGRAASSRPTRTLYGKGSGFRQAGVELTTFRVEAVGRTRKPVPQPAEQWPRSPQPRRGATSSTRQAGRLAETAIWQWLDLPGGHRVAGPAVIEHPETTVYVAGRQTALVDEAGNLTIDLSEANRHERRRRAWRLPRPHRSTRSPSRSIRNKLQAITEEQAITLKSVSGSPVVTDATDFNNGLYLGDGSIVDDGAAGASSTPARCRR